MSSLKLSELVAPEAIEVLRGAVTDVAECSFFTPAGPAADDGLPDLGSASDAWLVAAVAFKEAGCSGTVTCMLPHDLARALFDAFNGRDPLDPPPSVAELSDLIGEFANMICGAWLTRTVNGPAFLLGAPVVRVSARDAALDASDGPRVVMSLNDRPLVVAVALA